MPEARRARFAWGVLIVLLVGGSIAGTIVVLLWGNWVEMVESLVPTLIGTGIAYLLASRARPESDGEDPTEKVDMTPENPQGSINDPNDGDLVSRHFRAEGSIHKLPPGFHLCLVVEIGGLLWPKEPEVTVNGTSWSAKVYEGGMPPNGRFTLSLYLVDDEGHREITDWLENGRQTGDYPGLQEIKGGQRLHGIKLRLE